MRTLRLVLEIERKFPIKLIHSAKLPTIAPEKPKTQTPAQSPLPPVVVEQSNAPLLETEPREKITFGLKRKAGSGEDVSASKKPKEDV